MNDDGDAGPADSEGLALAALEWIDATAVADGDGAWWSAVPSEPDSTTTGAFAGPST